MVSSRPTVLHKSNKNEKCASHQGLALPKIKRNETLSIVKGSNAEPQTTSKSHFPDCQTVAPEVRKVSAKIKPLPLCKKSGQLPSRTKTEIRSGHRSQSESLSDESETISNLMKFFSPKIKRTAPKKSEKSGVKSVKKPTTCGNCTNCEINKQIRRSSYKSSLYLNNPDCPFRCGRCPPCRAGDLQEICVKELKCLQS